MQNLKGYCYGRSGREKGKQLLNVIIQMASPVINPPPPPPPPPLTRRESVLDVTDLSSEGIEFQSWAPLEGDGILQNVLFSLD